MEIFWMLWYGLETYTNVLPLQRRSYLLSAHSIQAGIWNLSFITNNILQHYNNVLKQLGYFVYFFCGLLFFAISTIIILPYKNLKQYFPFVLIITLLPQIIMFFLFHRHSSYFYISITYLSAMLALCATLLIDYKKNNTVIACGALICCIFWSKYNPDHLMKIRNYDFKIPPANATEMVNYSIGSHFYPDAPFLVMHPNAFSRPRYRGLDNALYYTNPRMKRFKTLKEFEKLFDPNGTILTIGTEQELFMKKLPADIIYKEVERDKRYIWYYCTRKL